MRFALGQLPANAGKPVRDRTTGSSGEAFHFLRSEAALIADAANSLRIFRDHRFDPGSRFADLRIAIRGNAAYPDGVLRPSWSHGDGRGDYAILDISTPLDDQVEWLLRMQPSIIFTWASNLRAIALELERRRERLPVTALATSAEASTPGMRADCMRVFGCSPVDIFGAREIGVLAWRCHAGAAYHLAAESAFLEIIRDDGEPARPGEAGRIVATSFYNLHTPFIRYATGDYVTLAAERCTCGRTLPALSAILGRNRNRLRLPDGRRIFPVVPEASLDALIGPLQWHLVQEEDSVSVRVGPEAMPRARAALLLVREAVTRAVGEGFHVDLAQTDSTSDGQRRKRESFRSVPA